MMVCIVHKNLVEILVLGMLPACAYICIDRVFKLQYLCYIYRCRFVNKVEDCWGSCFKAACY